MKLVKLITAVTLILLTGATGTFAYRSRDDDAHTMEFIEGAVYELTGYQREEFLGSGGVSFPDI